MLVLPCALCTHQGIRVSQRLAVLIHFTPLLNNPTKQTRELKIATDAVLSSCLCMLEMLQLPAYKQSRDKNELDYSMIGYCAECLVSCRTSFACPSNPSSHIVCIVRRTEVS